MTVLKILKSLWLKIRPYTSKRCCAVFLFIWDLLIQNPLRFLRNLNTGELWLQKSRKIALFCPFWLFSQTNKTNRTAAHKFKSLLLRQKEIPPNRVGFLFGRVGLFERKHAQTSQQVENGTRKADRIARAHGIQVRLHTRAVRLEVEFVNLSFSANEKDTKWCPFFVGGSEKIWTRAPARGSEASAAGGGWSAAERVSK